MQVKHTNNGACPKCKEIMNKYPNFDRKVWSWFMFFQAKHPEAHISCAGRGHADQQAAKAAKASRADYGESSHNYNAAIDLFVILPGKDLYDESWFKNILAPEIPFFLKWYGDPALKGKKGEYYELPHIERRDWKGLRAAGELSLVEPFPDKGIA